MKRNKKVLLISAALVGLIAGAVTWQVVEVNRTGVSPLVSLLTGDEEDDNSTVSESDKIVIVLREEQPTPTPEPTAAATPDVTPTPSPTAKATAEPTKTPQESSSQSNDGNIATSGNTAQTTPKPAQTAAPTSAPTSTPTQKPTPTPRPTVNEATPAPTPEPEVTEISLDAYNINILVGDSWRINVASAPSDLYDMGATWVSGNGSIVKLSNTDTSGVTITGMAAGTTTVTVYSKAGKSASCTVTVS